MNLSKEKVKNDMWFSKMRKGNFIGLTALCGTCGGKSITFCKCAEEEFKNNITENDIISFLKIDYRDKILDDLWKVNNNNFCMGICQICPTCNGSSASTCACAEKNFKKNVTDKMIEEHIKKILKK